MLAVSMLWPPTSPLVQTTLHEAKRARTQADPNMAAVPPPLLGRWAWPTDLPDAVIDCNLDSDLECMVLALGARIVNCLTIRPSSARFAVTAVPLLEPFPGLPEIPCSIKRGRWSANEPPEAITALVLLAWCLWRAKNRSDNYIYMRLLTVHHKAMFAEAAGLVWWARACSCDRAAIALISRDVADELGREAELHGRSRPKKPKAPRLYAYLGGGVAFQPDEVSTIVVRTTDMELLAAVVAAVQVARMPRGMGARTGVKETLMSLPPAAERF